MKACRQWWGRWMCKHPKLTKWVREGGLFVIFSNLVTVFQYIVYTWMPHLLGLELAAKEVKWPALPVELFGVAFTWNIFGYDPIYNEAGEVIPGGGLGYMIALYTGSFLAQCINFPLQRNITFRSKGNPWWQAMWYFIAWLVINPIVNAINSVWLGVTSVLLPAWISNIGSTVLMGGVSMVIFFFVFKIIFPEGEAHKKKESVAG